MSVAFFPASWTASISTRASTWLSTTTRARLVSRQTSTERTPATADSADETPPTQPWQLRPSILRRISPSPDAAGAVSART
eukprot:6204443-Pleurochrysis_carterae.AAC.3